MTFSMEVEPSVDTVPDSFAGAAGASLAAGASVAAGAAAGAAVVAAGSVFWPQAARLSAISRHRTVQITRFIFIISLMICLGLTSFTGFIIMVPCKIRKPEIVKFMSKMKRLPVGLLLCQQSSIITSFGPESLAHSFRQSFPANDEAPSHMAGG